MKENNNTIVKPIEDLLVKTFPFHKIISYNISAGSNPGDNYVGILHAIEVELETKNGLNGHIIDQGPVEDNKRITKHLVLKVSPDNPARAGLDESLLLFHKEIAMYEEFIPALMTFLDGKNKGGRLRTMPFVKHYSAKCVTGIYKNTDPGATPWSYILMEDLRKHGGYKMVDRLSGADYQHTHLVIEALAKFHALNYAFKASFKGTDSEFLEKYSFLRETIITPETMPFAKEVYGSGAAISLEALRMTYGEDSEYYRICEPILKDPSRIIAHFITGTNDLSLQEMLETPPNLQSPDPKKRRNQWIVATHGDSWINNFMFKYGKRLGGGDEKPIGVKMIDFQLCREFCLTTDLAHFLYCGTTPEFRQKHLTQLLVLYYWTFKEVCGELGVEPWVDFTLENLEERFGKTKVYGGTLSLCLLPILMVPHGAAPDIEETATSDNIFEGTLAKTLENNDKLVERVLGVIKELIDERIFS